MWAQARCHLHISSEEFWGLTPRQFHLLYEQHRNRLVHLELLFGWNTASILNTAPYPREEAASPLQFMPNHSGFVHDAEDESQQNEEYMERVLQLAAELKAGTGPTLARIQFVKVP